MLLLCIKSHIGNAKSDKMNDVEEDRRFLKLHEKKKEKKSNNRACVCVCVYYLRKIVRLSTNMVIGNSKKKYR